MAAEHRVGMRGRFLVTVLMTSFFFPTIIMIPSGNRLWLEGWIFSHGDRLADPDAAGCEQVRWSPVFPVWLKGIGGVTLLPALYLIYRAIADNTFLSARVRIQTERDQHVITTGVYGFVRYPLISGAR